MRPEAAERSRPRQLSGGIHTQAMNYLGAVQSAVDARTGQFNLAIKMPALHGNNLAGPVLSTALSFNMMGSTLNQGYGLGWSLLLSELVLEPDAPYLLLSSGERFAVDWEASGDKSKLVFSDNKLRSMEVVRISPTSYQISDKSGEIQILTQPPNRSSYLLSEIRSPEGRRLFLKWSPAGADDSWLDSISDENRMLLKVERQAGVKFVFDPQTEHAYALELSLANDRLASVKLPETSERHRFVYESTAVGLGQTLLLPKEVNGPLGARDTVFWSSRENSHKLPEGAPFGWLPRVTTWSQTPGDDDTRIIHEYVWKGTANFLGYGTDAGYTWEHGRDNLYQVNKDYLYSVEETLKDHEDTVLAVTTRTWNRFHLQTLEQTVVGQCEIRTDTEYGVIPDATWEMQPAYCQLPHLVTVTYIDHGKEAETGEGTARRSERSEYSYDDYGNVLRTELPTGVVECSEYYPADGSAQGCPRDASGQVRFLKKKTTFPAPAMADVEAPTLSTSYVYEDLPSLIPGDPAHSVVVQEQLRDESIDQLIESTAQTYVTDAASPHYGQIATSITTLNGLATTTRYTYSILKEGWLRTTTIIEGHDYSTFNLASRSVTHEARSLTTGLIKEQTSAAGVVTQYEYDLLGRNTRTLIAADGAFEAERTCSYHINDEAVAQRPPDIISIAFKEETDVTTTRRRSWLDGAGRVICVEHEDKDNAPGTFREISRTRYDPLGRVTRHTSTDWLPNPDVPDSFEPLTLTHTFTYDDWGNAATDTGPDGVTLHTWNDPIGLQVQTWRQSASGVASKKETVIKNVAGSAVKTLVHGDGGVLQRCTQLIRDGLDRMIEQSTVVADQPPFVTQYRYDAYSRIIEKTFPDDTRVRWTYALHSDGNHPQCLEMDEVGILGRQTFDGLGRPLTIATGGRETQLRYVPNQLPACAHRLPDGSEIAYTYEPQLENRKLSIAPAAETVSRFTYDPTLGFPTSASGALGTQELAYKASGQPRSQTWTVDGQQHVASWQHSLNGLLLQFDDEDGATHRRFYDACGRVRQVVAGEVTMDVTYDSLSRPDTYTARDAATGHTLTRALTYDGMGRERTRTFSTTLDGTLREWTQTLVWSPLDQLVQRQWQDAEQRGEETFDYDNRDRLVHYTANDQAAPVDPFGNRIVEQTFTFNKLSGYERVSSLFLDDTRDEAAFSYATDDPAQVRHITHTHASWPQSIELTHDQCGRLISDTLGRVLRWDAQGRLIKVDYRNRTCDYRYDPPGQLSDRVVDGALTRSFFNDNQPTHERSDTGTLRLAGDGQTFFAQTRLAAGVRQGTTLLGSDAQGSVRLEADADVRTRHYTPHGADPDSEETGPFGFAGERKEALTGWYIQGGYRPYDPVLMSFLSPDSESPFGRGGLNPYAYCAGDPVNRIDPDGHGWLTWALIGITTLAGIAATVASFGTASLAFATFAAYGWGALTASEVVAIGAATLSAVSLASGAAASAMEVWGKDDKTADILGWISFGTGLGEWAASSAKVVKMATRLSRSAGRAANKILRRGTIYHVQPLPKVNWQQSYAQARAASHRAVNHAARWLLTEGTIRDELLGMLIKEIESYIEERQAKMQEQRAQAASDVAPPIRPRQLQLPEHQADRPDPEPYSERAGHFKLDDTGTETDAPGAGRFFSTDQAAFLIGGKWRLLLT